MENKYREVPKTLVSKENIDDDLLSPESLFGTTSNDVNISLVDPKELFNSNKQDTNLKSPEELFETGKKNNKSHNAKKKT